jgi:hypothetical protein
MGEVPKNFSDFQRECFAKIRRKLIDECMECYSTMLERYSSETEVRLQELLVRGSQHTTLPNTISEMSLRDIISKHDQDICVDYADVWDYNVAGVDLKEELRRILDNEIITAQFKTAVDPYNTKKE